MSSISPRLAAFAAVLALALVPAGCGSDSGGSKTLSKQEYGKQVKAIAKQVVTQFRSLQAVTGTADAGKQGAAADAAAKAFSKLADRLDKIEPPKAIADAHQKFAANLRVLASDLGKVTQGLAAKSKAKILAVAPKLQSDGDDLDRVGRRIDAFLK